MKGGYHEDKKLMGIVFHCLFTSRDVRASGPVAKYSTEDRPCSKAETKPPSAIFTAPPRWIPITYTGLAALQRKVFGAMSGGQSILPAEFPKHGKPWNGRFPPINPKISPGSI